MEFHQLRYFVAAAETLHVSRAALREHVSQPAMSRQIALLERRLGVALFERVKRRIHLTEAGRAFLPRARQILCDAETAVQQVRERFGGVRRTLRLGFIGPFLDDLVAPAVRALRTRQPRATVALFELTPRAQLDRLHARELDAGILANIEAADRTHFACTVLSRHRMALAVPEGHPLARRRSLKLAELRRDRWVSLADTAFPGRREFLQRACGNAGFEPEVVLEVDSVALMLGSVAAGEGVAMAPVHSRKLPHAGCVFVPLAAPAPASELLLVSHRSGAIPGLDQLAKALQALARGLDEG